MVVWGYEKYSTKIVVLATNKQRIGQLKNSMGVVALGERFSPSQGWDVLGKAWGSEALRCSQ